MVLLTDVHVEFSSNYVPEHSFLPDNVLDDNVLDDNVDTIGHTGRSNGRKEFIKVTLKTHRMISGVAVINRQQEYSFSRLNHSIASIEGKDGKDGTVSDCGEFVVDERVSDKVYRVSCNQRHDFVSVTIKSAIVNEVVNIAELRLCYQKGKKIPL